MIEILIFFLILIILTFISKKFGLFPNFTGENHQIFLDEKKIPLIGGILFLILSLYIFLRKKILFFVL